jgi:molybdopterin molybdotransferase
MVFFKVKTTEEVLDLVQGFQPVGEEIVPLEKAFGRVLSKDVVAPEDLPGFARTSVDGYAIRAKDSFGATENLSALFEIVGEVRMGQIPAVTVAAGQAVRISTGGMVPQGADGVVMVEYCHLMDQTTLEVSRVISPMENVIQPDDDFKKGETVRRKGWRLRSQDVGVLAGLGVTEVPVHRKPRVAIISTGDEVVPVQTKPNPGQVRDINTYTLSAFSRAEGAKPVPLGLCRDDFERLRNMLLKGLDTADTVWISGGSSVGTRDLTLKVFESIEGTELLVHGISISPGKPTIIAKKGAAAIFGLPGHTASAMVVAEVFLAPFLERLGGETSFGEKVNNKVAAKLSRNIESASGRDDFIRVRLIRKDGVWIAEPIFGKSGLISTLVEADGLLRIDRNTEGLYQGQEVEVMRFRAA